MAAKFKITSELNMVLGPSVDRAIDLIGAKLKKTTDGIPVSFSANFDKLTKQVESYKKKKRSIFVNLEIKRGGFDKIKQKLDKFTGKIKIIPVTTAKDIRDSLRKASQNISQTFGVKLRPDSKYLRTSLAAIKNLKVYADVIPNTQQIQNNLNKRTYSIKVNPNVAYSGLGKQLNSSSGSSGLTRTRKQVSSLKSDMEKLGAETAETFRRFGLLNVAFRSLNTVTSAFSEAFTEALAFEQQILKISQVTGSSIKSLSSLTGEITRLATGLGTSSTDLSKASEILAQAGLSASETRESLQALAKTTLSPTFDDVVDTTEAAIAAMAQFNIKGKDLEGVMGSINAVSAKFAVESADLAAAIRRTGGAFQASGGSLNELLALFTSVRSTTRESAESIATGFRTIFTRLQRARTQDFLKTLNIDLRFATEEAKKFGQTEGDFIGPYKAIERLSAALNSISSADPRYSQIIEELGGFRQISKVIPLIQKFSVSQQALAVAQQGVGSLARDAEIAQKGLQNRITKVREEFNSFVRDLTGSGNFKEITDVILDLSQAFIDVAKNLKEVIPLFLTLGAVALKRPATNFISGFASKFDRPIKRNSGGTVPGSGNRDTIPAMLTPGEFVINKEAVKKVGLPALHRINSGKVQGFNTGGLVGDLNVKKSVKDIFFSLFKNIQAIFSDKAKIERLIPTQLLKNDTKKENFSIVNETEAQKRYSSFLKKNPGIGGYFDSNDNSIYIKDRPKNVNSSVDSVRLHEYGHFRDKQNNNSLAPGFLRALSKDLQTLTKQNINSSPILQYILRDFNKKGQRTTRDDKEVYAETFARVIQTSSSKNRNDNQITKEIQQFLPNVYSFVKNSLEKVTNNPPPRNLLSKAYYNFTNSIDMGINTFGTFGQDIQKRVVSTTQKISNSLKSVSSKIYSNLSQAFSQGLNTPFFPPGRNPPSPPGIPPSGRGGSNFSPNNPFRPVQRGASFDFSSFYLLTTVVNSVSDSMQGFGDQIQTVLDGLASFGISLFSFRALTREIVIAPQQQKLNQRFEALQFEKAREADLKRVRDDASKFLVNNSASIQANQTRFQQLNKQRRASSLSIDEEQERRSLGQALLPVLNARRTIRSSNQELPGLRQRIDLEEEQQIKTSKYLGTLDLLTTATATASAALTSFGAIYGKFAEQERKRLSLGQGDIDAFKINRQREIALNTSGSIGGVGSTAGGVIGAAIGGIVGSFTGPGALITSAIGSAIGTAIGSLSGLATGAIIGNNQGSKIAESEASRILFQRDVDRDSSFIQGIASRSIDAEKNIARFSSIINKYNKILETSTDIDLRTDVSAALDNSTVALSVFLDDIKSTSDSLQDFNKRLGSNTTSDLLVTFANLTNQFLPDYINEIEESIKSQQKKITQDQKAVEALKNYENQIKAVTTFSQAFNYLSQSIIRGSDTISSYLDNRLSITDNITPQLENPRFSGDLSEFFNQESLGAAGKSLGIAINDSVEAIKILPAILNNLRTSDPFALEKDFTGSLEKALDRANIGGTIRDIIVSRAGSIIGADVKDANIFQKLNREFPTVLKEFEDGFQEFFNAGIEASRAFNEELQNYASGLERVNSILEEEIAFRRQGIDIEFSRLDFEDILRTNRGERPNFEARRANVERLNEGNPQDFAIAIKKAKENLENLIQGNTFETQAKFLEAKNKEISAINQSIAALKRMAEDTTAVSQLMNELSFEQEDRNKRLSFAERVATANPGERFEINKQIDQARVVANEGISAINPDDLEGVFDLLRSLGDEGSKRLIGFTANQLLERDFEGLGPSPKETSLEDQIRDLLQKQNEANDVLRNVLEEDRNKLSAALVQDFKNFTKELTKTLDNNYRSQLQIQKETKEADLKIKEQAISQGSRIKELTGADSEDVLGQLNTIKQIKKERDSLQSRTELNSRAFSQSSSIINDLIKQQRDNTELIDVEGSSSSTVSIKDPSKVINSQTFNSKELAAKLLSNLENNLAKTQLQQQLSERLSSRNFSGSGEEFLRQVESVASAFFIEKQDELRKLNSNNSSQVSNVDKVLGVDGGFNAVINKFDEIALLAKSIEGAGSLTEKELSTLSESIRLLSREIDKLDGKSLRPPALEQPFARGGIVPGKGNRDTVPAVLTPGEFVVKKSSVQKYGADFLSSINEGVVGYASGGRVNKQRNDYFANSIFKLMQENQDLFNKGIGEDKEINPIEGMTARQKRIFEQKQRRQNFNNQKNSFNKERVKSYYNNKEKEKEDFVFNRTGIIRDQYYNTKKTQAKEESLAKFIKQYGGTSAELKQKARLEASEEYRSVYGEYKKPLFGVSYGSPKINKKTPITEQPLPLIQQKESFVPYKLSLPKNPFSDAKDLSREEIAKQRDLINQERLSSIGKSREINLPETKTVKRTSATELLRRDQDFVTQRNYENEIKSGYRDSAGKLTGIPKQKFIDPDVQFARRAAADISIRSKLNESQINQLNNSPEQKTIDFANSVSKRIINPRETLNSIKDKLNSFATPIQENYRNSIRSTGAIFPFSKKKEYKFFETTGDLYLNNRKKENLLPKEALSPQKNELTKKDTSSLIDRSFFDSTPLLDTKINNVSLSNAKFIKKNNDSIDSKILLPQLNNFYKGLDLDSLIKEKYPDLPESIRSKLVNSGLSVSIADDITSIDPSLKNQTPRGYKKGSSFSEVKGLYQGNLNRILLQNITDQEVFVHELGHAFDTLNSISSQPSYKNRYLNDSRKIKESDREKLAYYLQEGEGGIREFFAASFANIVSGKKNKSGLFQDSYNFVENLIKDKKKFNTGGYTGDTVRALLTPGEFVMNKNAVSKYGTRFMQNINQGRAKFANGGQVGGSTQSNSPMVNTQELNKFVADFATQIQKLNETLRVIPSEITLRGSHEININLNGAQVLQNVLPSLQEFIKLEIGKGINKMLKNKFPEAGSFDNV